MDKKTKFRKLVWDNRKALVTAGISYDTLYTWAKKDRLPSEDNAKKISAILGVPLSQIPHFRREFVV